MILFVLLHIHEHVYDTKIILLDYPDSPVPTNSTNSNGQTQNGMLFKIKDCHILLKPIMFTVVIYFSYVSSNHNLLSVQI